MLNTPPHSHEAEQAVLGSILLDYIRVMECCIEGGITEDSFYVPAHRTTYAAMLHLHGAESVINLPSLIDRLRTTGQLDAAGGVMAIHALVDNTYTAADAEQHIAIVAAKHKLRRLMDVCQQACVEAAGSEAPDALIAATEQAVGGLADTVGSRKEKTEAETWDEIEYRMEHAGEGEDVQLGIETGLDCFDRNSLLRFRPGGMYLLMGRQKSFKTTVACAISNYQVRVGRKVGFCSREMPKDQLMAKMAGAIMNCSMDNVLRGTESVSDAHLAEARALLRSDRLTITDSVRTVDEFISWYKRGCRKHKWDLVVLDYLQKLDSGEKDRWEGIRKASERVTDAVKSAGVPILCVAIPSDDGNGMNKMYGSKQGDFDAFAKVLVNREYENDPDEPGKKRVKDSGWPDFRARVWVNLDEQRFGVSGVKFPVEVVGRTGVVSSVDVQKPIDEGGQAEF